MRRFLAFALVFGLLAFLVSSSAPARAAVAVHTYQITSGTSSGALNIGAITGGGFTVQYSPSLCSGTGCAYLLTVQPIVGTAGMITLSTMALTAFNANAYGMSATLSRTGYWRRESTMTRTKVSFSQYIPAAYVGGNVYVFTRAGPTLGFGGPVGHIRFYGHEVAVPEPSSSALLATAGLMLGAYALRRARRSPG